VNTSEANDVNDEGRNTGQSRSAGVGSCGSLNFRPEQEPGVNGKVCPGANKNL